MADVRDGLPRRGGEQSRAGRITPLPPREPGGCRQSQQYDEERENRVGRRERAPLEDLGSGRAEVAHEPGEQLEAVRIEQRGEGRGQGDAAVEGGGCEPSPAVRAEALGGPAAQVQGEHAEAGEEAAVRVGPDGEERREHPEEACVGRRGSPVGEDAVEDEDDDPEERVREQLGTKAPARRRGERDEDHGDGGRPDATAPAPSTRDHQPEQPETEQAFQGRETGAPGVVCHEGEDDLAQVLVVDPRLSRRRVGVGGRRRKVAAREDVLAVTDVSPEVRIRSVDGREDQSGREEQRDEQSAAKAVRRIAAH